MTMARSSRSFLSEKDLEVGVSTDVQEVQLQAPTNDGPLGYDAAVVRVTSLDDQKRSDTTLHLTRTISRKTTTRTTKDLEAVLNTPWEVKWNGPDDNENPLNWSFTKRGYTLMLVSIQTLIVYENIFREPCLD
jgi:hypothetical protein